MIVLTEQEKEFDKAFKDKGGICLPGPNTSSLLNMCLQRGAQIIDLMNSRHNKPFDINFNLINNKLNTASSRFFEGKYYIGINIGLILSIKSLYGRLLAHPEILATFGDVSKEIINEKLFEVRFASLQAAMSYIDDGMQVWPIGETRKELVYLFFDNFLVMTIYHEFAHISKGHLNFKDKYMSENTISTTNLYSIEEKKMILQGFEFDADIMAITQLLRDTVTIVKLGFKQPEGARIFYANQSNALFLICFAITCSFKMFENVSWEIKDFQGMESPPSDIRLWMIYTFLGENIKDNTLDLTIEEFDKVLGGVIVESAVAFSKISEQPIKFITEDSVKFEAYSKYFKQVHQKATDIAHLL